MEFGLKYEASAEHVGQQITRQWPTYRFLTTYGMESVKSIHTIPVHLFNSEWNKLQLIFVMWKEGYYRTESLS
jgi:hypothetical protein